MTRTGQTRNETRQKSTSRDGYSYESHIFQKPACAAARSATLPRAAHVLTYSVSSSPCPVGWPHPPPPGVSIRRRSPLPMRTVAFPPTLISRVVGESPTSASPSSSRPCLIQVLRPSAPGKPPSRPYGPRVRRYENKSDFWTWIIKQTKSSTSDRIDTCKGSKNSSSRIAPSPPWNLPAPEEPWRSPKVCTSTGYRRSSNSTSPIRVLVMCVWTPDVPCQVGPAPEPPAIVYVALQHSQRNRHTRSHALRNNPILRHCDLRYLYHQPRR